MKRFVLIVLINSFLGFFIISCCDEDTPKPQDPCSEIRCGSHGSCKSGRCECETGYKGSECEISLKPLGFRVEKVLLVDWDDNNWDSSSGSGVLSGGPDWYIRWAQWKSGGKIDQFYISSFIPDAENGKIYEITGGDLPFVFSPFKTTGSYPRIGSWNLNLLDWDGQGNPQESSNLGIFDFSPADFVSGGKYPETIRLWQEASNGELVDLRLQGSWVFD